MYRKYVLAAWRNLSGNRLYAAINIGGLVVGFAAAILIGLYVRDELSYDRWLPLHQRTYLVGASVETNVLTRKLARKYFGRDTPLGEKLEIDRQHVMTVTAIVEDFPSNANLKAGMIASGRAAFSEMILTPDPVATPAGAAPFRQGLIWRLLDTAHGVQAQHGGLDPGANTYVAFEPGNGIGALAFANVAGNKAIVPFQQEVTARLLDKARAL